MEFLLFFMHLMPPHAPRPSQATCFGLQSWRAFPPQTLPLLLWAPILLPVCKAGEPGGGNEGRTVLGFRELRTVSVYTATASLCSFPPLIPVVTQVQLEAAWPQNSSSAWAQSRARKKWQQCRHGCQESPTLCLHASKAIQLTWVQSWDVQAWGLKDTDHWTKTSQALFVGLAPPKPGIFLCSSFGERPWPW